MGFIPEEIIAQVIDRTDIVETINGYVPLKKAGRNFKANCPFHHEKTPSFIVTPDKQIFHCFGCGAGGDVIGFVMKQDRLTFPEAVRLLAQRANIEIPENRSADGGGTGLRQTIFEVNAAAADYFHQNLVNEKFSGAQKARKYLQTRGVELATVEKFRLGFALEGWDGLTTSLTQRGTDVRLMQKAGLVIPREKKDGYYDRFRNRIIFPIFDTQGHCRAFGARALDPEDNAKYINSPETPVYTKGHYLYGFHWAKQAVSRDDEVVVVEGYMDCLMPVQAGFENIVASLGTALTVEQVRLLRRYTKNVVMLFDMDPAGESAMMRSFDMLVEEGMNVRVAQLPQGEDPDSFVRAQGVGPFRKAIQEAKGIFDYKIEILLKKIDRKTAEGKARIAEAMLPTIQRFTNAVIQAEYLKRLAGILDVPEKALREELDRAAKRLPKKVSSPVSSGSSSASLQVRPVERSILKLLLEEEDLIGRTREEVAETDFQDEKVRDVITKIYDHFVQGKRINISNFIHSFEDEKIKNLISGVIAEEQTDAVDKERMHRDCIERIKSDRQKLQRQELLRKMKDAEARGDSVALEELKQAFSRVAAHRKKPREKRNV